MLHVRNVLMNKFLSSSAKKKKTKTNKKTKPKKERGGLSINDGNCNDNAIN